MNQTAELIKRQDWMDSRGGRSLFVRSCGFTALLFGSTFSSPAFFVASG